MGKIPRCGTFATPIYKQVLCHTCLYVELIFYCPKPLFILYLHYAYHYLSLSIITYYLILWTVISAWNCDIVTHLVLLGIVTLSYWHGLLWIGICMVSLGITTAHLVPLTSTWSYLILSSTKKTYVLYRTIPHRIIYQRNRAQNITK